MKDTINKNQFINWFRSNEQYKNNFSYEGLSALFDYLEEIEEALKICYYETVLRPYKYKV